MTHRILSPSCLKCVRLPIEGVAVTFLFASFLPFFWLQLQVTFSFWAQADGAFGRPWGRVLVAFCEK